MELGIFMDSTLSWHGVKTLIATLETGEFEAPALSRICTRISDGGPVSDLFSRRLLIGNLQNAALYLDCGV